MDINLSTPEGMGKQVLKINENIKEPALYFERNAKMYNKFIKINDASGYKNYIYTSVNNRLADFTFLEKSECINIDGACICAINRWDQNYSHFTLQCLSTLFLAKYNKIDLSKVNILIYNDRKFKNEIFKLFNFDKFNIIELRGNIIYNIENLIYSDLNINSECAYNPFISTLFEEESEFLNDKKNKNLYISRKSTSNRKCTNEDELIDEFGKRNFLIVDFDKIPVEEQIKLIKKSNIICAAHGASGANLLYTDKTRFKFIEYFSSNRISNFHTNILINKNADYYGSVHPSVVKNEIGFSDEGFTVNKELLKKYLTEPPSYEFDYEERKSKNPKDELISLINAHMTPEVNIYYKARRFSKEGKFDKAYQLMKSIDINNQENYMLREFYKFILFEGNFEDFEIINGVINKRGVVRFWKELVSYNLKIFNLSFCEEVLKKCQTIMAENDYKRFSGYVNFFKNLKNGMIATWHGSILYYDDCASIIKESNKLKNHIVGEIRNSTINLFIPDLKMYIKDIDENGKVELSPELYNFEFIKPNEFNCIIKNRDLYFCSYVGKPLILQDKMTEDCRFYIYK